MVCHSAIPADTESSGFVQESPILESATEDSSQTCFPEVSKSSPARLNPAEASNQTVRLEWFLHRLGVLRRSAGLSREHRIRYSAQAFADYQAACYPAFPVPESSESNPAPFASGGAWFEVL